MASIICRKITYMIVRYCFKFAAKRYLFCFTNLRPLQKPITWLSNIFHRAEYNCSLTPAERNESEGKGKQYPLRVQSKWKLTERMKVVVDCPCFRKEFPFKTACLYRERHCMLEIEAKSSLQRQNPLAFAFYNNHAKWAGKIFYFTEKKIEY